MRIIVVVSSIMYRELEEAMNELGISLGEVLAVAREISPHDPPIRTIDRLTARERVELVSVLRSACGRAMAA